MAKEHRTVLIYIVKDDGTAIKIEGDDAEVWEKLVAHALKLLQKQDPETAELLFKIKSKKVQLMIRKVTAQEFKQIKGDKQEDP